LRATKLIAGIVFSLAAGLVLAVTSGANLLPAAPDKFTYDWRTALFAERAPHARDDIAIVLIDEKSLAGYSYVSPIDRGLIADLVKLIDSAGPKAIGLDFIFDRRTEPKKDDALVEAIRQARAPVILGAIDARAAESGSGRAFQDGFLSKTARPAGHIFFGAQKNQITLSDQAVRFMMPRSPEPPNRPSFARVLADLDGKKPEPASSLIYWRRAPSDGSELFPTFTVPTHRDEAGNAKGSVFPESWRSALKGKIVLIGGAFQDRDRHFTPLTVASHRPVHGIEIHAQILAQLRDGRSIHEAPWWLEFPLAAIVTGLGILAAWRWTLRGGGAISTGVALVAIVSLGGLFFWAWDMVLPSASLFYAWAAGLFAGNWSGLFFSWLRRRSAGKAVTAASG
jgi:adenylate cyclase